MASTQTKVSRVIVLGLLSFVVYIAVTYSTGKPNREAVRYSTLGCIQSVCVVNKTTGDVCNVSEPRVSEVLIESDSINPNILNIRVIPSDDRCQ